MVHYSEFVLHSSALFAETIYSPLKLCTEVTKLSFAKPSLM